MSRLTGRLVETATVAPPSGGQLPVEVLQVDKAVSNMSVLRDLSDQWQKEAKDWARQHLPREQVNRARFAGDTAFLGAKSLMVQPSDERLYAIQDGGQVLGLHILRETAPSEVLFSLQATRPQDQPSSPNPNKIRGIGTTLARAIGHDLQAQGITRVRLRPLDDKARSFWQGRGFVPVNHFMELQGERVRCLVESCSPDWPDAPDAGEFTGIGDYADPAVTRVTLGIEGYD